MISARRLSDGATSVEVQISAADRKFLRQLSLLLVLVSSAGAMFVLVDPVVILKFSDGTIVKLGGNGFSDQIKGAVVALILVGGFTAVIAYWLGASNQGMQAQEVASTIAQQAAPEREKAVAAARAPALEAAPPLAPTPVAEATPVKIMEGAGTPGGPPLSVQEQPKPPEDK